MKKSPLMAISIIAGILLILGSLTNVVGYQTVQSSNQKTIKENIDQKELLFQTIIDLANNKEIQKIISISEMRRGGLFNPSSNFLAFTPPVLTKKFLNTTYHIGLILSKTISKSKMHSILERYQVNNQEMQKEITSVIEKNSDLTTKINELSDVQCDCEKSNTTGLWNFPILCTILFPIGFFIWILWFFTTMLFHVELYCIHILWEIIVNIGLILNCFWT